jgi:uncharacterized membrane protein YkgB
MIGTATATMPMESDTDNALSEILQALGTLMTRYVLVVVFAWIRAMKFIAYEATGYSPAVFEARNISAGTACWCWRA